MEKITVSIFGMGFVGFTCYQVFSCMDEKKFDLMAYDKYADKSKAYKEWGPERVNFVNFEEAAECDICFIALPTPMNKSTGECLTHLIEETVEKIRSINKDNLIVLKSTVVPGTTRELDIKYGNVIFNPEFLTEANAVNDFYNIGYQIIGTTRVVNNMGIVIDLDNKVSEPSGPYEKLAHFFQEFSNVSNTHEVHFLNPESAEMIKYMRNTYLATRLSFFNEQKQICDKLRVDFATVKHLAGYDPRVGKHYNAVYDSNPGWGGKCLYKDINGLIYKAKELGVSTKVLDGVLEKNLEVRKYHDWDDIEGAVE